MIIAIIEIQVLQEHKGMGDGGNQGRLPGGGKAYAEPGRRH